MNELIASMTYMYPDRYPSGVRIKWEIVPTIHVIEFPVCSVEKFHPGVAAREENGRLRVPPLTVATRVRALWHHL